MEVGGEETIYIYVYTCRCTVTTRMTSAFFCIKMGSD